MADPAGTTRAPGALPTTGAPGALLVTGAPCALLVEVWLATGRYHGVGDWPPAPFRLFQALVAGAYGGRWAGEDRAAKDAAFRWLEALDPPYVCAPPCRPGPAVTLYVPNNDLDAKSGDPRRVAAIRTAKRVRPAILEADAPLLYAWFFAEGAEHAASLAALAGRLHTLGWGVDAAWARGAVLDGAGAAARLEGHGGAVRRPSRRPGGAGDPLCPMPGSLDSLKARHAAAATRFRAEGRRIGFRRPEWATARPVAYDPAATRLLYDLHRSGEAPSPHPGPHPWPLPRIAALAVAVRDGALARLSATGDPGRAAIAERVLVGRGAGDTDKARRVRILPLPSLGTAHTDASVRRVLVEVPPDCPLDRRTLDWAFAGLELELEGAGPVLVPATDRSMLRHYGVGADGAGGGGGDGGGAADGGTARLWRTVTPAALPAPRGGCFDGTARLWAEERAAEALCRAVRHAGIATAIDAVRVRREPWHPRGARAEAFAPGTRFPASRLWHAELLFAAPVPGPLALGDGRYLGLGLMAPVRGGRPAPDRADFAIAPTARPPAGQGGAVVAALRRALMALARDGAGGVATLFSGHEEGPGAARSGAHRHVFLLAADGDGDGRLDRLTVLAPWLVDRTVRPTPAERADFARVVGALAEVRAGRAGVLPLTRRAPGAEPDPARRWRTATPYRPTRHPRRRDDTAAAIADDVRLECRRRGLPVPDVRVLGIAAAAAGGLEARVALDFAEAVPGPILLGRDAHSGGGLFVPDD